MPTLPGVRRESLQAADPGSLVSVKVADGQTLLGLRVWLPADRGDPQEAAFVALQRKEGGGLDARWLVARRPGDPHVDGRTRVVNHSTGWSIHVEAKDWNPDFLMNFALEHAGLLLASEIQEGSGLSLAVAAPYVGACHLLRFDDWTLHPIQPQQQLRYAAAARWRLALPAGGADDHWVLEP